MRAAIALVALLAACGTKDKSPLDGGSADGAMASGDGATSTSDGMSPADGMVLGDGATSPVDIGIVSTGCGTTPANPTSYTANTVDGNGRTREYDVFVPSPYDANKPLAVTFVWHGGDESKYSAEGYGVQTGTGAADASIFVFPVGILYQPTGELGWDVSCGGYDMPFFDHMLAEIEAQYCVDPRRVFSAGFSFGCDFSTALMCCRADRVRAIGAASCSNYYGAAADYTTFVDYSYCPAPLTTGGPLASEYETAGPTSPISDL